MDMTHLKPFLDAMHDGNGDGLAKHMTDDVTLRSPIIAEPFEGKKKVLAVLSLLLDAADSFEVTGMLEGDRNTAVFVTIRAGDTVVQGVDDMHVDEHGLVSSMTIQWRPLASIVAMQQLLAPKIGVPVLELVER
jgi:hypothetical protein